MIEKAITEDVKKKAGIVDSLGNHSVRIEDIMMQICKKYSFEKHGDFEGLLQSSMPQFFEIGKGEKSAQKEQSSNMIEKLNI